MDGLYFYSISWAIWIISTFIVNKNNQNRLAIACIILFIIIFSPHTFTIRNYTISYVAIFILMVCFSKVITLSFKRKCYLFITSLIIAVGYVTFELFELFDPIWIILKREWMLSLLITYLTVLLEQKLLWRMITVITGCMYGEFLFALTVHRFSFPYTIGSMAFLDVCSLTILMLSGWSGIKMAISFFENHYHTVEGKKQKTT